MWRARYEKMRAQVSGRVGSGTGSDIVMRQGMRSWMETGRQQDSPADGPPPAEGHLRPDRNFQQIVAVWAGVLMGQAERSYGAQRKA
jgi:hypothetical protein